jgi:hypothetical protein
VYIYEGSGISPVDTNSNLSTGQPLGSASVTQDGNGAWAYTAAFLAPAAYTVAFTCQATLDLPDSTDGIAFQNTADVTVTSGNTTSHDFP